MLPSSRTAKKSRMEMTSRGAAVIPSIRPLPAARGGRSLPATQGPKRTRLTAAVELAAVIEKQPGLPFGTQAQEPALPLLLPPFDSYALALVGQAAFPALPET